MQMRDPRPESARGLGCLRPSKQCPSRPRKTTAPASVPHPHHAEAGSRDRASAPQVPGVKVEKAERSCLGAGLRGKLNLGKPGETQTQGWARPSEEPATNTAWSLLRVPLNAGTLLGALANFPASRTPRLRLTSPLRR